MVTGVRFLEPSPVTMLSPLIADERLTKMYYMSSDTTSRSNSYLHTAMKNFTLFVIHSYTLKYNYALSSIATSFELAHYGSQPFNYCKPFSLSLFVRELQSLRLAIRCC